jgi:hypothetical protein
MLEIKNATKTHIRCSIISILNLKHFDFQAFECLMIVMLANKDQNDSSVM